MKYAIMGILAFGTVGGFTVFAGSLVGMSFIDQLSPAMSTWTSVMSKSGGVMLGSLILLVVHCAVTGIFSEMDAIEEAEKSK